MRTIKAVHKAEFEPIGDLVTYRAMPTKTLPMNALDPFIFLNHHGYQEYPPANAGLPFGPHPHRGFETVTFILKGDLTHLDSGGHKSIIHEGGIQWMRAGSGLIHAEISSDEFKIKGGPLEILQLWVNLPARLKMTPPQYTGLQEYQIPQIEINDGVRLHAISGNWHGTSGPVRTPTDIALCRVEMKEGSELKIRVPVDKTVFLYVVKGAVNVNGSLIKMHHLPEFNNNDENIVLQASQDAMLLLGHATPFHESFFAYGPFVMNTREEITTAYDDYRKGKFGKEDDLSI